MKSYNFNRFHHVERNFLCQTGDPTGTGRGGESIFGYYMDFGNFKTGILITLVTFLGYCMGNKLNTMRQNKSLC
jgi:hypothetical protein